MSDLMKKYKARKIRKDKGVAYVSDDSSMITSEPQQEGQYPSTHLMVDDLIDDNTGKVREEGPYHVWPSISPGESGEYSSQSFEEAKNKGELFTFNNPRKAEKFAWGSWKKGDAKKDAMRDYRNYKKEQR